ncbi:restriction endonuclease-like protein [Bacteroides thetaiotaomicron]|uniref:restriction endonuclease-like protein n=1 Tax=Bacteroides thetaiotaomicron TaxID=818 RepID=UPI00216308B9|nr:restriction endonuclease-like protein [Bacteroides thetaiotaomicron]MCS2243944.1 restriction endonuclease-like protein [Bacteroides thetaiotaomicron]UVP54010.1 restriction endonuclease-like protein [Bacteroides thetaiotaomicron]
MELLTIKHQDFKMIVECAKFDDIWHKAKSNIGEECLHSTYSWSEGVSSVILSNYIGEEITIENSQQAPAIFFDNTDYPIWVEFKDYVKKAQFGSILQSENEKFTFRRQILAGFLNYGNEVGRSEIQLIYQVGAETRSFVFSFEVLSTKLNYHEHWKAIIEDIEQEYRMLSLDYMRRTFHGFSPDASGETPEIIWWSVFANEQKKFIKACKNIIDRPRHRLHGKETYKRADKLTFVPSCIENELAEHRADCSHLYRVEERVWTNDTKENRFLKFSLGQITDRYEILKKRIEAIKNASDVMKEDMQATLATLKHLQRNPFFRTVGNYKGMNQESLVLQKATGYSQIYRTWSLLHRSYSLNDGIYRLQTKDIATLYEIWCFIEVSHIVKEKLHLSDEDIDHRNRMEMNGLFTWDLGKGEHSRILFKKDDIELAELVYNPKSTERENLSAGIKDWTVPTVPQKPDIVLQLTKNDLQEGMKMTYLFDAKYRIDGKDKNGVDVPPEDAINQMHRYRDAIYYKDYQSDALKKEVIGGYILFPGDGEPAVVAESKFRKTIDEVNIGAFPLRPKDTHNRQLLERFIEELILTKSYETISKVIPQKGALLQVPNRLLIGLVGNSSRPGYTQSFLDGNATLYHTGPKFPTTISLHDLHYFIPYIKSKGVRDIYEIVRVRTITGKEAKQTEGEDATDDMRLAFELRFSRKLFDDYRPIDTHKMISYTFIDTTFDEIEKWVVIDKF